MALIFCCVHQSHAQPLQWQSFKDALSQAKQEQKPVMVDVWAPWCGWCRKMKSEVYPKLAQLLNDSFVLSRLNREAEQEISYRGGYYTPAELAEEFKVYKVPGLIFLAPDGSYLFHTSGFIKSPHLQPLLQYVADGAYKEMNFKTYQQRNS